MLKKLLIAAAGVLVAVPALADPGWDHGRPWGHWKRHHYARQVVVVPAPRVYYAPPPVYYAPPPRVVYAPPPPVLYEPAVVYPAPVAPSGVSIRLHFPL
ncbi:MAG: hypothetical protein EPO20_11850 [Betaproteobacteria bacterium]|nr:MAG: hypothetical protein EPO20_11850 [Betaproteobacteria bacterium]